MGTKSATDLESKIPYTGDHGNGWNEDYSFAVAGVANGDVLRMGRIPAGTRVNGMGLVHDDCGTGVTGKLGYQPCNAADGPTADDDYWLAAGQDVAAAAGRIESKAHPITFEYDVYIIFTVGGADFTGTPKLTAVASGFRPGIK